MNDVGVLQDWMAATITLLIGLMPVLCLWIGPALAQWRYGRRGAIVGMIFGVLLLGAAAYSIADAHSEICEAVRHEFRCEISATLVIVVIGWFFMAFVFSIPRIVRIFRPLFRHQVS